MTWHPSDDDLILHFYGESAPDIERRVDEHLATCHACQTCWTELREMLHLVDAAAVPEPGEGFERVMWARVQRELPARRSTWSWRQVLPVAAWAATVVAAVGAGFAWEARHPSSRPEMPAVTIASGSPGEAVRSVNPAKTRERVLLTALDGHFEQTEMLLVELMNGADTNEFAFERSSADDLVSAGRLYRVTAQQNGDVHLAQMLDDLEAVLVEVARSPQNPNKRDLASLREQISTNSLLFKVRSVTNEIHGRQQTMRTESE